MAFAEEVRNMFEIPATAVMAAWGLESQAKLADSIPTDVGWPSTTMLLVRAGNVELETKMDIVSRY